MPIWHKISKTNQYNSIFFSLPICSLSLSSFYFLISSLSLICFLHSSLFHFFLTPPDSSIPFSDFGNYQPDPATLGVGESTPTEPDPRRRSYPENMSVIRGIHSPRTRSASRSPRAHLRRLSRTVPALGRPSLLNPA